MRGAWLAIFLWVTPVRAESPCAPCHPRQVQTYGATGMGRSVGNPAGHPAGTFKHARSGSRFTIESNASGMRHRVERPGEILEFPVHLFIGSGRAGRSYAARSGGRLVQSPASWFGNRRTWDVSPGYEEDRAPNFKRRITSECLFCHASGGEAKPEPIGCERCHGAAEAHLAKPTRANIVSPGRLPPRERDSVCEQCHLGGEARIPNPGRAIGDFQPGRALEEVIAVYLTDPPGAFRVTGHAEELARSACAQASGARLWCGTCHNPHEPVEDRATHFRARCIACHTPLTATHPRPAEDCAGCHMPKRATEDVAHTAFTDHRIARRAVATSSPRRATRLRAWREPTAELARRNLGLAYVSAGERDGSAAHLDEGYQILSGIEAPDPEVETALGLVLMRRNAPADAARRFERALAARPDDAVRRLNLGAALRAAGDVAGTIMHLTRALELDPLLDEARRLIEGIPDRERATALYQEKRFAEAAEALERHLARRPEDFAARLLLGLSLQQAGRLEAADRVLTDAARRRPRDAAARFHLARVEYLRGLLDEAERSARRALDLGEPEARARNLLGRILVEKNRSDEALSEYEAARRADAALFDPHLNAGVLLLRLGRREEALERLGAALERNPRSAEARYHRARALLETGRLDAAKQDLEAAGDHEPARRLLEQLRAGGVATRAPVRALSARPIRFRNVAAQSGLRFTLENNATPQKHLIETMPGGVAAFDYDNDGRVDVYFCNGAAVPSLEKEGPRHWNRLFRNEGGMRFTDVTEQAGVAGGGYSMGAAAADFDNDGDTDLFVAGVNENILYRNRGDGSFEDITGRSGISSDAWAVAAGWFDYDRDGRLDLFVVNYLKWAPGSDPLCLHPAGKTRVYCHPSRYEGLTNRLYRNRGDGTFEDVSARSGIAAHRGKGMSAAFADADGDGHIDVFVANDTVPNFLFRNRGDGTFEERGLAAGIAVNDDGRAISSMGIDVRDYDGDGLADAIVTALIGETFPLFRNQGDGFFRDATYPSRIGLLSFGRSGWSVGLVDFNNDGWKDVFAANSHVSDHLDSYRQPNSVFAGSAGTFEEATAGELAAAAAAHRGAAFADFDDDGRVDAVVSALGGPAELWHNVSPGDNRWIALRLEGMRSNRDGIGARVRVAGRHNVVTSAVGYASSSPPIAHFGLGKLDKVEEIEIVWPSGTVQVIRDVLPDQVLRVRER